MAITRFPPPESANPQGLLAIGGDLEISSLLLAYSQGIFPWPISPELPLAWFSPDPRGVLFYKDLIISKGLQKKIRKNDFKISFNKNFREVIKCCSYVNRRETWITPQMIEAYCHLFARGHAYSVEVCDQENQLVGGLYGVCYGDFFSGESMFYRKSNASKTAIIKLMEYLKSRGIDWLDTQMVTPVVAGLGGREISRMEYLKLLKKAYFSKRGNIFNRSFSVSP
ncbi:MAG: leucyl/phenylalanyl-tRNA--protein transferase [Halobacteriovoraceae bacterium]|nr:leucyl/phenylalanyl-tRNA--protein transferase [Halobacteriovoraceae bacterium]